MKYFKKKNFQKEPRVTFTRYHTSAVSVIVGETKENSHSLDLRQVSSTFARAKHTLRKQGRRRRRRRRHAGFIPFRPFCTFHGEHRSWRGKADERGRVKRGRHRGEESEAGEGESVDRREGNSLAASFPARLTWKTVFFPCAGNRGVKFGSPCAPRLVERGEGRHGGGMGV